MVAAVMIRPYIFYILNFYSTGAFREHQVQKATQMYSEGSVLKTGTTPIIVGMQSEHGESNRKVHGSL